MTPSPHCPTRREGCPPQRVAPPSPTRLTPCPRSVSEAEKVKVWTIIISVDGREQAWSWAGVVALL